MGEAVPLSAFQSTKSIKQQEKMTMYWYALFVKTGLEQKAVDEINAGWSVESIKPFIPMYDVKFRKAGKVLYERRRLFPGYVFVESKLCSFDFYNATSQLISKSRHIIKLLAYDQNSDSPDYIFEMKKKRDR
jgi:transcriptional antiterminator NusG